MNRTTYMIVYKRVSETECRFCIYGMLLSYTLRERIFREASWRLDDPMPTARPLPRELLGPVDWGAPRAFRPPSAAGAWSEAPRASLTRGEKEIRASGRLLGGWL